MTVSPKEFVIEIINSMQDDVTAGEIVYRIYFEEKLRKARLNIANGEVYTQEEAHAILDRWIADHSE